MNKSNLDFQNRTILILCTSLFLTSFSFGMIFDNIWRHSTLRFDLESRKDWANDFASEKLNFFKKTLIPIARWVGKIYR